MEKLDSEMIDFSATNPELTSSFVTTTGLRIWMAIVERWRRGRALILLTSFSQSDTLFINIFTDPQVDGVVLAIFVSYQNNYNDRH